VARISRSVERRDQRLLQDVVVDRDGTARAVVATREARWDPRDVFRHALSIEPTG
jgi:hypothetical protein